MGVFWGLVGGVVWRWLNQCPWRYGWVPHRLGERQHPLFVLHCSDWMVAERATLAAALGSSDAPRLGRRHRVGAHQVAGVGESGGGFPFE